MNDVSSENTTLSEKVGVVTAPFAGVKDAHGPHAVSTTLLTERFQAAEQ